MRNTFNKFNITDQFYENTEKKDLNPFIDIEYRNDNKSLNSKNIIHTVKNVDNKTNTKFLPRLELFSKHPQTTKKNNFFVTSFRDKYTSDNYKLKSIQISTYDINPNIHNNISNNSNEINDNKILNDTENKYNKELISRSLGSINIIKSIDLINSVNFGNNFLDINKSNSDNLHLNLNLKENEKSQNNGINKKQNQYEEKKNNDKKRMNKNHYILNPDYNCTYNFPFKKISIDDEIKRNINKFNSFVQRKFNLKKYSNLSMTPRRLSNNNNKSKDQEKKSNNSNDNVISISDNIEESIHTHFSNHGNKIQSESNKPNSNKSTNQYINSKKSEKSKETGFIFETNNKISLALDNIVGKVIKGKLFSWVVGDILYESANSTIYKAFNINDD